MSASQIVIKNANVHNLKQVNVTIQKNQLVVCTGLSGSGKSSLCMDTLYAEGQRRYVESLSSYARQFLNRLNKPDVESIKGLCPAIAIDQKVQGKTSRATVGSQTEIYDYLRLLYARIGTTISPVSGKEVKKNSVTDVVDFIFSQPEGTKVIIAYPIQIKDPLNVTFKQLLQKGFSRILVQDTVTKIESILDQTERLDLKQFHVVTDRLVVKEDADLKTRAADSVDLAFFEGHGDCLIHIPEGQSRSFSNRFELDGMSFEEPNVSFFNFNSPFGACTTCEGFGSIVGIDPDLVIPDKRLSVFDGAIAPWKGEKMGEWLQSLLTHAHLFHFPIHRPYKDLTSEQQTLLWEGNQYFKGLHAFFTHLESKSYKIQYRVMLSRYRGKTRCTSCNGKRIRKETDYVNIDGKSIGDLLTLPISELNDFFQSIKLSSYQQNVSKRILIEINTRLRVMSDVGLQYLTLNRLANTLSGGELQRIKLTRSLGSNLTSSMYILDEPSIGLHAKDTDRLTEVLKSLRDMGNTVVVVEHDEDIILAADQIIDMGPAAGIYGGEVVFSGSLKELKKTATITTDYLTGKKTIPLPDIRRKAINKIQLTGASHFNLKHVDITIPLNALTVVAGVSGSGKTTLIKKILYPALQRELEGYGDKPGEYDSLTGDISCLKKVELVDQNPLGRSSRSNPITYIKAYDAIRDLFTAQSLSKIRGYKPRVFSFNVEGGRCEHCKGEGEIIVEMQFLADVSLECDTCKGKRFKEDVLEVKYKNKSIFDVLNLSIDEAVVFFDDVKDIKQKLLTLQQVGLGYVKLGQSSNTLSGGEAQRVKLASFLTKGNTSDAILFIFDEPTTGLHFDDINKLLNAFQALIHIGHSVLVIEHNMEVIKCADWMIELGPEGGKKGGHLIYQGIPEGIVDIKESPTAPYLRKKLVIDKSN